MASGPISRRIRHAQYAAFSFCKAWINAGIAAGPASDTACFQIYLDVLSRKFRNQHILLVLDGAPNHQCGMLAVPDNISLLFLPPYSPELNPKENLWDEIREKIFKNFALKSMNAVRAKLKQAVLYIERNPKIVKSITSFPYIAKSI